MTYNRDAEYEFRGLLEETVDCGDCRKLRDAFFEAVRDVVLLNELQVAAVMQEDPEPQRFEMLIHAANERKQEAKYAYLEHREQHSRSS